MSRAAAVMAVAPASYVWLACEDCGAPFDVEDVVELSRHTMRVHFRKPTSVEQTPRVRALSPLPETHAQHLDQVVGLGLVRKVDQTGRVWGVSIGGFGFTRHEGVWCSGYFDTEARLRPVPADQATLYALDRWELATTPRDPAPTPAHGIVRPLILMAGAR